MKNFILTLSVFFMVNFVVSGQEIIKTKSIEQIEVKSPTLRHPEAKSEVSKKDSSVVITMYCGPRNLNKTQMPLYLIKNEEKYYKLNSENPLKGVDPNQLESIKVINKLEDAAKFGIEGQYGVILIGFKEEFVSKIISSLNISEFKLLEK